MRLSRATATARGRRWNRSRESEARTRTNLLNKPTEKNVATLSSQDRVPGASSALKTKENQSLLELVDDVVDVVADDKDGSHRRQDHEDPENRLHFVDSFHDCGLGRFLMAERVVNEDLVFLVPFQPGTINPDRREDQYQSTPDRPHDGHKCHNHLRNAVRPRYRRVRGESRSRG